ncbi:hypothetical protein OWM07_03220 [Deferribacter thermophilus]|uniref:hypothetical protein n=1 Tax=Deferribacter thermophilus TaxID=53573 RepID=UPI003C133661
MLNSNTNFAKNINLKNVTKLDKLNKDDFIIVIKNFRYIVTNLNKDDKIEFLEQFFIVVNNKYRKDEDIQKQVKHLLSDISKDYFIENTIVKNINNSLINNFFNIINKLQFFNYALNIAFITGKLLQNNKNKEYDAVLQAITEKYPDTEIAREINLELKKEQNIQRTFSFSKAR